MAERHRLLDELTQEAMEAGSYDEPAPTKTRPCDQQLPTGGRLTMTVAEPYADHADYQQRWTP